MKRLVCALIGHAWHIPTGFCSCDPIECNRCGEGPWWDGGSQKRIDRMVRDA